MSRVPHDPAWALAPLDRLIQTLVALLPPGAAIPPGDRERARLRALLRAAEHLCALPERDGADEGEMLERGAALRARAASTLALLGQHAATELPAALSQAASRWEQAGTVTLLHAEGRAAALALQTTVQEALDELLKRPVRTPAALGFLGVAAESMTAVDSACTLLRALEARFAPLLREQLRRQARSGSAADQHAALLPGGRPFLPVGEALLCAAAALGWSAPPATGAGPAPPGTGAGEVAGP